MWLVDGIYGCGYNVLVWLVGCVVRRYIDILIIIITFLYSTCISSFFGSSIPTSLFIFKMFFSFLFVIFVQYSKCCSKNIQDRSKIEIMRIKLIISTRTSNVHGLRVRARESRDFHVRGRGTV